MSKPPKKNKPLVGMSRLLRRRNREEDLLLTDRLRTLKLKIMEQPTDICHAQEDREGDTGATSWEFIVPDAEPAVPNESTIYLEPTPVEDTTAAEVDYASVTAQTDPYFVVSNLVFGMKMNIEHIKGLLEGEPSTDDLCQALSGLSRLSEQCDEIEKRAGMTSA